MNPPRRERRADPAYWLCLVGVALAALAHLLGGSVGSADDQRAAPVTATDQIERQVCDARPWSEGC